MPVKRSGPRLPAPTFPHLLERAGFRIRGRRADCPNCEGHSRLTVSFTNEVAYCHRCHWTANVRALSRALGARFIPETREAREKRDRAAQFSEWMNTLYLILSRRLRLLTRRAELAKNVLNAYPDCGARLVRIGRALSQRSRTFRRSRPARVREGFPLARKSGDAPAIARRFRGRLSASGPRDVRCSLTR